MIWSWNLTSGFNGYVPKEARGSSSLCGGCWCCLAEWLKGEKGEAAGAVEQEHRSLFARVRWETWSGSGE